jgi:hypothetical protein
MTGGGIRLAFRYGRRAAALIADHLQCGGPVPEMALAREVPRFHAKKLMRAALDLAPPNALINFGLGTKPMRHVAERLYFHRRNPAGVDRQAYRAWLEREAGAPPAELAETG